MKDFGPLAGDFVQLGKFNIFVEVENEFNRPLGGEILPGLTGNIDQLFSSTHFKNFNESPDLVITNAVVLDFKGIYKADIAVKNGNISAIGKSGLDSIQDGVTPKMSISPYTRVINASGMFLTPGIIDANSFMLTPEICDESRLSGITTLISHCNGVAMDSWGNFINSSPNDIRNILKSVDSSSVNILLKSKGVVDRNVEHIDELLFAGVGGICIPGTAFPADIDLALDIADEHDLPISIHGNTFRTYPKRSCQTKIVLCDNF